MKALVATAEAVLFIGGLVALFVLVWLLAPEGAGWPS